MHETEPRDYERVMGAEHPHTLAMRGNLALAYKAATRTAEAIAMHEQNLTDSERVLGGDHVTPSSHAATSPSPTRPQAARPRRSPCTRRISPTTSG